VGRSRHWSLPPPLEGRAGRSRVGEEGVGAARLHPDSVVRSNARVEALPFT
jgi:hypothetical protein